MALCDYRLCDVCGGKAFYDADLSYESGENGVPYKVVGQAQYAGHDEAFNLVHGMRLGYLGDWAVLCDDCAKTHRCVIVLNNPEPTP